MENETWKCDDKCLCSFMKYVQFCCSWITQSYNKYRIYDEKEGCWSERTDHSHVNNKMLNKRDIYAAYFQNDIIHIGKKYGILAQLYHEHRFYEFLHLSERKDIFMYNVGKRICIRLLLKQLVLPGNSKATSIDAFFNKRDTLGSFTRLWNNLLANMKSKCEDWSNKFHSLKKII